MIASVKMELWYLNTPEMMRLSEDVGQLKARGVMLSLLVYLRLSHHAVGSRQTLSSVARDCGCDADWLWHVICDYGLFTVSADETFFSPYLSQTLGINRPERRSSRRRTRYNTRYNEDNNDNNDNENKTITSACVCLDDTQQTDYRSYEKYMKR